jgi:hypothetical protein
VVEGTETSDGTAKGLKKNDWNTDGKMASLNGSEIDVSAKHVRERDRKKGSY